jgi:ATP-dependent DNA ligase
MVDIAHALTQPIPPMEAKLVSDLPESSGWQFEPKWDGFRAIAVKRDGEVAIWSKSGKPLGRYFPELVALLGANTSPRFILDGEIIVPLGGTLSFGALQARLHPAPSRITRLSQGTPALMVLFDVLELEGRDLTGDPFERRRAALEVFHRHHGNERLRLSPRSADAADARAWLGEAGGALDGVVAKRLDLPYLAGERAMAKVKQLRTADCVLGGFRKTADGKGVASLLLGLYDDDGKLDHVGFTSGMPAADRPALLKKLTPLVEAPGFTGKAPGGPSRWATERSTRWSPLRPDCVVEIVYDQITDGRFRHGTRLLRWRPDKAPAQCTRDQLVREISPTELEEIINAAGSPPAHR